MWDPIHSIKNLEIKILILKTNIKNNLITRWGEWDHLIKISNCRAEMESRMIHWFLVDIYKLVIKKWKTSRKKLENKKNIESTLTCRKIKTNKDLKIINYKNHLSRLVKVDNKTDLQVEFREYSLLNKIIKMKALFSKEKVTGMNIFYKREECK